MASDIESIPSAVATTLPLRYPVTISTTPIAKRVTTDIFAILLPAIIPSRTKLEGEEEAEDVVFCIIAFSISVELCNKGEEMLRVLLSLSSASLEGSLDELS